MADDLPRAHVAHRLPRRLRVHIPARKGDRAYFDKAAQRLIGQRHVQSVRVSSQTGSITIEHDGTVAEIADLARLQEVFDLPEAAVVSILAEAAPVQAAGIDPVAVVSAGLAGLGVFQMTRGNILGGGLEHIWHAFAARRVGSFKIAAVMAMLGAYQMARGQILNPAVSLFFYAMMVRAMYGRR